MFHCIAIFLFLDEPIQVLPYIHLVSEEHLQLTIESEDEGFMRVRSGRINWYRYLNS